MTRSALTKRRRGVLDASVQYLATVLRETDGRLGREKDRLLGLAHRVQQLILGRMCVHSLDGRACPIGTPS